MNLINKKIILGLCGGIACYKAAELVRLLRQQGAQVQVVMTQAAKQFITPLTLQALSGQPVRDDLFGLEAENAMSHIELARAADMILIVPASADIIAQLAHGFASNLLATVCLASQAPIVLVPAMNAQMWENSLTQKNIQHLRQHQFTIWGPAHGEQACGEFGFGRMLEPQEITQLVGAFWQAKRLAGKKVLLTAGPTQEMLDPVRYFSNFSSGKMGYALAAAAVKEGAEVILIAGPTHLCAPAGVRVIAVKSAADMHAAVFANLAQVDIFIGAAAVADYRPQTIHTHKIKKSSAPWVVELVPNVDIIAEVARSSQRPALLVGFAAESENLIENAKNKLQRKELDVVIANIVGDGQGFGSDDNAVMILDRDDML